MTENQGEQSKKIPHEEALRRGKMSEKRFSNAFKLAQKEKTLPDWVLGWRKATYEEDQAGIDAWINTDVGPIPVQIKTSRTSARKERAKIREQETEKLVIQVRRKETNKNLLIRTLVLADEIRRKRSGRSGGTE